MSTDNAAGDGVAAAHAAMIQAVKAMGVIVRVDKESFLSIVERSSEPLVVHGTFGFFTKKHRYLLSYRGLAFTTDIEWQLTLPMKCDVVEAKTIWLPA